MIFFFIAVYVINLLIHKNYPFTNEIIRETFLLKVGIPYIWIVRVFTYIALISPLIVYLYRRVKSNFGFILLILAVYIFYEIMVALNIVYYEEIKQLVTGNYILGFVYSLWSIVYGLIPWAFTFSLGVIFYQLPRKIIFVTSFSLCSIFRARYSLLSSFW